MCSCQNKGIGRKKSKNMAKKRRRHSIRGISKSGIAGVATSALIGGVGAVVVGKVLKAALPPDYAQYINYAAAGAGVMLSTMTKNPHLQAAGLGAATVAAAQIVGDLADGQGGIQLLPPGQPQYRLSGTPEAANGIEQL